MKLQKGEIYETKFGENKWLPIEITQVNQDDYDARLLVPYVAKLENGDYYIIYPAGSQIAWLQSHNCRKPKKLARGYLTRAERNAARLHAENESKWRKIRRGQRCNKIKIIEIVKDGHKKHFYDNAKLTKGNPSGKYLKYNVWPNR